MDEQEYNLVISKLKERLGSNAMLHLATQNQVSIPVVVRIAKKIQQGLFSSTISVKDNKICEGHDRYLASLLINNEFETVPGELSRDHQIFEWSVIKFSSVDFDSEAQKEYYILQTANANGIETCDVRNILNNSLIL